jgi:ubiquinone/menaquinone biosynthesis C-methylase UbiE
MTMTQHTSAPGGPSSASKPPSPELFFETINAYQRPAALRAAIELELFTNIGAPPAAKTADELAAACKASLRGVRILCDYLTILGFLKKQDGRYALTLDTAMFLDKKSRAYVGGAIDFLLSDRLVAGVSNLAETVRRGTTILPDRGTVGEDHTVWVKFARAMAPLQTGPANALAEALLSEMPELRNRPVKILDIAAGHGLFGIVLAQRLPQARVASQDFAEVLQAAQENATKLGVADRFEQLPGDAFEIDLGQGKHDLVLVTNFLHHFDREACVRFLKKAHAALVPGGQAVTVEFVPNEDRISPPTAASFSMMMLAGTPSGDAYTFGELERMFRDAGFEESRLLPQQIGPHKAIVSKK